MVPAQEKNKMTDDAIKNPLLTSSTDSSELKVLCVEEKHTISSKIKSFIKDVTLYITNSFMEALNVLSIEDYDLIYIQKSILNIYSNVFIKFLNKYNLDYIIV